MVRILKQSIFENTFVLKLCTMLGICVCLLTLTSCEHKELYRPKSKLVSVEVIFDWKYAPEHSATGMSLYLFPEDGKPSLQYDFPTAEGGIAEIPSGRYKAIFINNNSETLLFRGTNSFEDFEVYTRTSSLLEPMGVRATPKEIKHKDEPMTLAPDPFWGGREFLIVIERPLETKAVKDKAEIKITLYPETMSTLYTVNIINVKNLKYVSNLSMAISGMSSSFFVGTNKSSNNTSSIPFTAEAVPNDSKVTAKFSNFGRPAKKGQTHTLSFYIVLSDGSKKYYTFDVTEQVNKEIGQVNLSITVDGLSLPKPIENGGGLTPTVEDWEDVKEDINM